MLNFLPLLMFFINKLIINGLCASFFGVFHRTQKYKKYLIMLIL